MITVVIPSWMPWALCGFAFINACLGLWKTTLELRLDDRRLQIRKLDVQIAVLRAPGGES